MLLLLVALAGAAPWPRTRRHFDIWNTEACDLCKYVGLTVSVYLEEGETEEHIKMFLDMMCEDVVASLKNDCADLTAKTHQFVEYMSGGGSAVDLCKEWSYC